MTDDELIRGFESCALGEFPHESHVRVAWCYLQRSPSLSALARFRAGLLRFAASKGKPDRYHETITVAFVLLIAERLAASRDLTWPEFAARYPELLQWQPSALAAFYSDELLASPRAREVFVMPDRTDVPVLVTTR